MLRGPIDGFKECTPGSSETEHWKATDADKASTCIEAYRQNASADRKLQLVNWSIEWARQAAREGRLSLTESK